MACVTAAMSAPTLIKSVRASSARASPSARICVVPRPVFVGKPGRQPQLRDARSLAARSVYGSCWGPSVVGCGPSYDGWRIGRGGQRSFEKWAEQASNNMWFPVDVVETNEHYEFVADVPGLGKNDIKVQVNKERVLSISGQRQQRSASSPSSSNVVVEDSTNSNSDTSSSKIQRKRQERRFGTFKRTWNLPEDADVSQIKASVEQGVLTLIINRIQPAEPEVTDIPIN